MATYKLIQDIEAEDHILGPLSLRQFIYGLIAAFCYYLCFLLFTRGAAFLMLPVLPIALFCTFFAFPFGKDQSTEVWALAQVRFWFKPRKRLWDQSGAKEMVEITAPKKIERHYTNGLDQDQVQSRLSALANTIDSRGWAVKNINVNTYAVDNHFMNAPTDRLVSPSSLPQAVPNDDVVTASEDMLDTTSNPVAQQFDQMINQSAQMHHQQLINQMNSPAVAPPQQQAQQPAADYWFMQQGQGGESPVASQIAPLQVQPQSTTPEEEAIAAQARERNKSQQTYTSHLRTIQPIDPNAPAPTPQPQQDYSLQSPEATPQAAPAMTQQPDPAILNLANNNDLNVATIAREANKAKHRDLPQDEVVISLR